MEHVVQWLQQAVSAINEPTVKSLIMFVGSWVWNRAGATINKAIPAVLMATQVASAAIALVLGLIANAFPQHGTTPASFVAIASDVGGGGLLGFLGKWVLPPLLVVGSHSLPKNFLEWFADGRKFVYGSGEKRS